MSLWPAPLIALVAVALGCAEGKMTVDDVRNDLETSLPIGSSAEQVIAHVNGRGYTSDGPISAADINPTIKDRSLFELRSVIRNTRTLPPVSYSIGMTFTFDGHRKLTAIKVEEVGTGP